MAFTAGELADISNKALETYIDRGTVWKQDMANKPMLDMFNRRAGKFAGGKDFVSFLVGSGYGGGALTGYTGDDQVPYYNPVGSQRARFPWKEHHIGMGVTQTELKIDGIDVIEDGTDQTTREMPGREAQALANILDEKNEKLGSDYTFSLDRLIHTDGSADAKALAGIQSILFEAPAVGTTGNINRAVNTWWRNDAMTTANGNVITSNTANGGALITAMDGALRRRSKFKRGATDVHYFAGTDFIDAYKKELRTNGYYTQSGWRGGRPDGSMQDPLHDGLPIEWDPTMDDIGKGKFCYAIDMGKTGLRLMYMDGQRMKKHNPARPYDRYVMYKALTMTGVLIAKQLNTSGVYEIA